LEAAASPTPLPSSRSLSRKLTFGLVAGTFVYGALLLYGDARALLEGMRRVPPHYLVIATTLSLGNFALRFVRWTSYLRALDIDVPRRDSVLVFLSGFAMTITPGKIGEILKPLMLHEAHGVPIARSTPIVVAERLTDLVGLVLLAGIGATALRGGLVFAVLAFSGVIVLGLLATRPQLAAWAIDRITRVRRLAPLRQKLLDASAALSALMRPRTFLTSCALSVVAWGLQGLALYVVALGFAGVTLSVLQALAVYSTPLLAGALAMIPGGLGLTEASMTGALQQLGGEGATRAAAAGITILVRLVTLWIAIAIGFAALSWWNVRAVKERRTVAR